MRILFLAHRLPYPPNKGDKIRSFWELKTLSVRHRVDLFCFYDDAEDRDSIKGLARYCQDWYVEPLSFLRARMQAVAALFKREPFTTSYFYSPQMASRVASALRSKKYDLIFVFSSSMAQYALNAADVPKVLDMVDVDSDKWRQYARHSLPPKSWLWDYEGHLLERYEQSIVRAFDITLLCTDSEARFMQQKSEGLRVVSLNNTVDVKYFDPLLVQLTAQITSLQPYIVFTGSMDYLPNIDAVKHFYSKIFTHVRAQCPEAHLVIAGRNPSAEIRQLANDPAVRVTGTVPDIRPYLRGASLATIPLRMARGIQNKVLEAMAMGVPVATTTTVAAALPEKLRANVMAEDDPEKCGRWMGAFLRKTKVSPQMSIRHALLEYVDGLRTDEQLETLVQAVVERRLGACISGGLCRELAEDGLGREVAPR